MVWNIRSSRITYKNRWMEVREDEFTREDGSPGLYGVVSKPDYALIVPLDNDHIYLVEQYRYPVSGRYWELPQGSSEAEPDKDPAELAKAELAEETGLTAQSLQHVGHLFQAYGYSSQGFNIFLATGLTQGKQDLDPEEQGLVCKAFPLAEVRQMIEAGKIKDNATLAAFGLLQMKGLLSFAPQENTTR